MHNYCQGIQFVARIFCGGRGGRGKGGGGAYFKRDQIINVEMIGHASSEDKLSITKSGE